MVETGNRVACRQFSGAGTLYCSQGYLGDYRAGEYSLNLNLQCARCCRASPYTATDRQWYPCAFRARPAPLRQEDRGRGSVGVRAGTAHSGERRRQRRGVDHDLPTTDLPTTRAPLRRVRRALLQRSKLRRSCCSRATAARMRPLPLTCTSSGRDRGLTSETCSWAEVAS